ncbi:Transposase family tnp2 [Rhizoctonia solani]|uniref:Transposase family tnp2 n=2 Tax=Rhizoctonia solani TaxID=456999 RepID=A0A8H7LIP4_9AGAM|nr:Transposase family tnp2 [Rhizoctonia solani]
MGEPGFDPNFRFVTPGAGPGPSSREQSPRFAPYNPAEEEEEEEEEDPLAALPWMHGIAPHDYYELIVQEELLRKGGLRLPDYHRLTVQAFNYKVDTDISGRAYSKLPRAFPDHLANLPMEPKLQRQIDKISAFGARAIHCCINSCIAYTGVYQRLELCPWCGEARYTAHRKNPVRRVPRRTFHYLPLIPRLINLFRSPPMAELLQYRSRRRPEPNTLSDIFDGRYYLQLLQEFVYLGGTRLGHRFFSSNTDMALGLSTDGVGPFKTRKQQCWPLIIINYNLPPSIRTRLENILCLGVIPGPRTPKELDTFLEPFIDELEELARGVPAFNAANRHPFVLRAYLIAAFGDMPAVAKMMEMKGPNGKLPCRACKIRGVRARHGPHPNTNYIPLSRPFDDEPHATRRYDPQNLPLRTHTEYLEEAMWVEEAQNDAEEGRRSLRTGINGLAPLARVPGLSFPVSFPHDFMHLIFENIIPTLFDLWTRSGNFEAFGSGTEEYLLHPDVWTTIAEACPLAGNNIPYTFGCRVPDPKKKRAELTAEARLLLATMLGPVLLRGRFVHQKYYRHFIELVRLINMCIDFEITPNDIVTIREGFAKWVKDYEKYYYMNDQARLSACTLPLHALLHIANDIEAMGPVWAYWAFPMERFCGALTRASMSRRFPYSSINRRVLQLAQLSQIKLVYGLTEELELDERQENIRHGVQYDHYPDLVFINPSKTLPLQRSLQLKIAKYLGPVIGIPVEDMSNALANRPLKVWGRMQRLDKSLAEAVVGGDVIRGAMVVPSNKTMRDASHVRFHSKMSRWRWDRPHAVEFPNEILSYGQTGMFVVIEADLIASLNVPNPCTQVLAVIMAFPHLRYHNDADLVEYRLSSGNYAGAEVVDATKIDCLIGRITTEHQGSFVVERTSVVGQVDMLDVTVEID